MRRIHHEWLVTKAKRDCFVALSFDPVSKHGASLIRMTALVATTEFGVTLRIGQAGFARG